MPQVFVVQEVLKKDSETGVLKPVHDLSIAEKYGELVFVLPGGSLPIVPDPIIQSVNQKLKDYTDEDYILPVGDPIGIGLVTAIVARNNYGKVNLLKWNRNIEDYTVSRLKLW